MIIALLFLLLLIFILPFVCKPVEHNLELFLFLIGLVGSFVAGAMGLDLVHKIFTNPLMYFITLAVLLAGVVFKYLRAPLKAGIERIICRVPLRLFVFGIILVLGVISSVITAIVASLVLVEIINTIPIERKKRVQLTIVACFSIGIGAVLTPIGEPLSTIVASRLGVDFFYFIRQFSGLILPCIAALAAVGALLTPQRPLQQETPGELDEERSVDREIENDETYKAILLRTGKTFLFIIALELLGESFKPIIDNYIIGLNGQLLYWGNMVSSILDNATLAAAEISPRMTQLQIRSILMGLLISGGMLIPGNIPNIISAGILKIKSGEWARLGVPLGLGLMLVFYLLLFFAT